jgi:hypothetical protein
MTTRWIAPLPDAEILAVIEKLLQNYPTLTGSIYLNGPSFNITENGKQIWKSLIKINGYAISQFSINLGQHSFTYSTNHNSNTYLAKLDGSWNSSGSEEKNQDIFALEFQKYFGAPPILSNEPPVGSAFTAGFLKIESALAGAVQEFATLQVSFQQKNQQLREQSEAAVESLRSRLEEEKNALELEISLKRDELSAARKEIDDRSNTHARRAIRTELKSSVTETLSQPSFAANAEAKRNYVRAVYVGAIIVLVGLAIMSILSLNTALLKDASGAIWITGIKASISSISVIGLILLYLRWETQWLSLQANFERVLSSTKVDIDRASWVAESLLEWNRESPDKEIPTELLQSFTRRLFDWDGKVEDHHSAQDSLASAILGSAAKLQIGPAGANLEYDRKALKELDKK